MKKFIKVLITLIIIAAVAAAGYFFVYPMVMEKINGGFNDNIAFVTQVSMINGDSPFLSNRYSAVIDSQETVNVDSDIERKIKTVYVKEGDSVKKGDKLFEYDIEEMQYQLDQNSLNRERAQSEIKSYNDQIATYEKEYKTASKNQKLVLENQIEATKLNLKKAEYELNALDKSNKKIENSIKNAVVKSSVDGVIKTLDDPTAASYITITSSGDFRVKAAISEEHIQEFYVDEPITIRSRRDENLTWSGKVVSIDTAKPISTNTSNYGLDTTTKYPIYISLDSIEGLLIGQHVTVEEMITSDTEEKPDDIWLNDYMICDVDTSPYVWVEENGALAMRSVTLGELDENLMRYKIESGLTKDDYLAFPEDRFFEGMETAHGFEFTDDIQADDLEANMAAAGMTGADMG